MFEVFDSGPAQGLIPVGTIVKNARLSCLPFTPQCVLFKPGVACLCWASLAVLICGSTAVLPPGCRTVSQAVWRVVFILSVDGGWCRSSEFLDLHDTTIVDTLMFREQTCC